MASGNYGDLSLSDKSFGGTVTIRSADGAGGAVFHSITVDNVDFLSFDSITVERPLDVGEPNYGYAVSISDSSNVAIANSEFFGSVDEDYDNDPNGSPGLGVRHTSSSRATNFMILAGALSPAPVRTFL